MNPHPAKFWLPLAVWLFAVACDDTPAPGSAAQPSVVAPGVRQVGRLAPPRLTESSGLAASRRYPGVFWTHTDGGGKKQSLFAIDREGKTSAEFFVVGANLSDWEDIAIDDQQHLYAGDLGNNNADKTQLAVYQIDEPDPKSDVPSVKITRSWQLRFPAAPFNCESLFIWQTNGYVISKLPDGKQAQIYRFPLTEQQEPFTLELVTRLKIDSPITGASLSADGKQLGLVGHTGAFVYRIDGNIANAGKLKPERTKFANKHIEGCCFVPDGLLVTSEDRGIFLFTDQPFLPVK